MIIGFTGKKRSGKSTSAQYLESKGFTRLNFKDALIAEVKERMPLVLDEIIKLLERNDYDGMKKLNHDNLFEDYSDVIRALLKNYGTDVRRADNQDYWTTKWLKKAQHSGFVVVDDVRFLNEAQAIRDMGGMIVRIIRSDMQSTDTHASETEMDQIVPDQVIAVETGHQDEMYASLDGMLEELNFLSLHQAQQEI